MSSSDNTPDDRAALRDEAMRRHLAEKAKTDKNHTAGLFSRASKAAGNAQKVVADIGVVAVGAAESARRTFDATVDGTEKVVHAVTPAAKGAAKFTIWGVPKLWLATAWATDKMWLKKGNDGVKHIDILYGLRNTGIAVAAGLAAGVAGIEAINWATVRDYDNVFVTNATHTQQFVKPSQAGTLNAATDEIFTVVGQYKEPRTVKDPKTGTESIVYGVAEPIRFDIDENLWMGVWRPDYIFSKIPNNNAICSFKVNGFFTFVPRFMRAGLLKYSGFKPHIIEVKSCSSLMDQLANPNAPGPWNMKDLKAQPLKPGL